MPGYNPMSGIYANSAAPAAPLAPIPSQVFKTSNILGTVTPQAGDSTGTQNYATATGGVNVLHTIIVVLGFIVVGYIAFHLFIE